MRDKTKISRRDLLENVGRVAALGAAGVLGGSLTGSQASSQQSGRSGGSRVLVLMGDRYHNQANIRASLHPLFTDLGLPVDYTTNYYDLSASLLKPYQLFVCFRDDLIWPGGYLGNDEDPSVRPASFGLENQQDYQPEKSEKWLTDDQGKAVKDYVAAGNGFYSMHNNALLSHSSKHYRDVQGGIALGHPPVRPFKVRISNKEHPITKGIEDFMVTDEQQYLTYDKDPKNILFHAENLDGLTYRPGAPAAAPRGGGRGQANAAVEDDSKAPGNLGTTSINGWAHDYEKGRVVFTALGHTDAAMRQAEYVKIQKNAVKWLLRMA